MLERIRRTWSRFVGWCDRNGNAVEEFVRDLLGG